MNAPAAIGAAFTIPGAADRTCVIGATGTGKTTFGGFLLSRQRFDKRPWVCVDFKGEELFEMVGSPPMQTLSLDRLPRKTGLYRLPVNPGDEEQFEAWLWKVWAHENIGLFCDEVSLIPQRNAFKALLRQGRSKRVPIICCTQRPVDCDREIFTEAQYVSVFRLDDVRDYKTVQGFTRNAAIDRQLPEHWSYWFDKKRGSLAILRPCPDGDSIAADLRSVAPYRWRPFGMF